MIKNYFLALLITILSLPIYAQTTVNLNPIKDNSIYSENVNNSSGLGKLFAGQTCSNNARRALLQFDLSSIPSGATINSVTLTLTSDNVSNGAAAGQIFTIYALSTNFGEGTSNGGGTGAAAVAPDATWNAAMFGSSLWANPGGDLSPLPITSLGLPASTGTHVFPSTNIFRSVINGWNNTPSSNFGLIVIGPAAPTCSARRFGSKDQGVAPILTINYTAAACVNTSSTDVQTACNSYTWIDGNIYTASNNTAMDTVPNAGGCDSIITLNLTLNNSNTGTDVQTACGSYAWIDGITYTTSNNTATFTETNAAGCDSVITLNLTINNPSAGPDVQTACDSYTWIDGNTYTSSNSTATFTETNAAGCDSIVSLNLTINSPTSSTDMLVSCGPITWIDGNSYTAPNTTATFTTTNAAGCDSIVTLNLSAGNNTVGTDMQSACDTYTWLDGNTYTADNNTATVTIPNAAGCDSLITLDLRINNSSTGTDIQSACNAYTWIDGNTYTASNNTATFTLTNAAGCDSVVTLNLTVNTIDVTTSISGVTITSSASGVSYQWIDCDNGNAMIAGETNQTFTATSNGNYAVIVMGNNCTDTSACVNIANVGISDNFVQSQISIYPNPNIGEVRLDFGNLENLSFRVFNTLGKVIKEETNVNTSSYALLLTGAPGLYFIEVESEGKSAFFKIFKK